MANKDYLEFEKPLRDLEERIEKLQGTSSTRPSVQEQLRRLKARLAHAEAELYGHLTPSQRTQFAPHPSRPSLGDYLGALTQDFVELHGDRTFGDEPAIVG